MADKGPGSSGRSQKKRLARAKIKPTDNGIKSSKGRQAQQERDALSKAEAAKARKQKLTAIGVGIFAVIMALSMMLPSLSYIFGNSDEQQAAQEQAAAEAEAAKQAAEDEESEEETPDLTGVALVDANYAAVVDPLKAKLEENPEDLATLLNLGNDYMAWANEASAYATEDEDTQHVKDLYDQAMAYFDSYLELNDSSAVKTNRALCQLYAGDTDAAVEALQKLVEETPDYGPAWANLGMIYEYQSKRDEAKEAYQKAIEADPDDEYGSKSYANRRIASMAASSGAELSDEATGSTGSDSSPATGPQALENALGSSAATVN